MNSTLDTDEVLNRVIDEIELDGVIDHLISEFTPHREADGVQEAVYKLLTEGIK